MIEVDPQARRAIVEPGVVLDHLNAQLRKHGLWFPVDVSTAGQATLGGMTGNNSCGVALDRLRLHGPPRRGHRRVPRRRDARPLRAGGGDRASRDPGAVGTRGGALGAREGRDRGAVPEGVAARGAATTSTASRPEGQNLAKLLVGSEGTLAWFERITLDLAEIPKHKALGVAHFPRFYDAMDAAQHIVKLGPCAVELVDRTMIELSRAIPAFAPTINAYVRGAPDAILLVEFAGDDADEQAQGREAPGRADGRPGLPGRRGRAPRARPAEGAVGGAQGRPQHHDVDEGRRKARVLHRGLRRAPRAPGGIHVGADRRVPQARHGGHLLRPRLRRLPARAARPQHEGRRPIRMRAIAEEAADLVRRYKGAYSGEHGDGLVRSEWIAPFFGPRLTAALAEIKGWFDPRGLMNPGKIVNPPKQDDRSLFRYQAGYRAQPPATVLDWSAWGGLPGAVEMCNNNGHCRKFDAGTMVINFLVIEGGLTFLKNKHHPCIFHGERVTTHSSCHDTCPLPLHC